MATRVIAAFGILAALLSGCAQQTGLWSFTLLNDSTKPVTVEVCSGGKCNVVGASSPLEVGASAAIAVKRPTSEAMLFLRVGQGRDKCFTLTDDVIKALRQPLRATSIKKCIVTLQLQTVDPSP
jgi:hypothetical protein